jgi:hypothetical protein
MSACSTCQHWYPAEPAADAGHCAIKRLETEGQWTCDMHETRVELASLVLLPRYALRLPAMREAARRHGYALAIHGSGVRDCDLIAAPWVVEASDPRELIRALCEAADGVMVGAFEGDLSTLEPFGDYTQRSPTPKPHGRYAWSIQIGKGLYFDVSVMSRQQSVEP